jgi:hypothetical protein
MSKLVPLPEDRQSEILEEFTRLVEENKDIESLFKALSDKYGPAKADAFLVGYIFGCAAPGMAKTYHPEIIKFVSDAFLYGIKIQEHS